MNFSSFCALFFFAKLLVVLRTFPLIFTLRHPPLLSSKIELGRALRHGNVKLKTDLPPSFLPTVLLHTLWHNSFFLFLEKNIGEKGGSVVACNTIGGVQTHFLSPFRYE